MPDETDMAVPVTRAEMDAALDRWGAKITEDIVTRFEAFAVEMRSLARTSETHILVRVEALLDPFRATPKRLHDLERHELPRRVDELDEARLPERVGKLEAKVFAPKRRATAARRKRS